MNATETRREAIFHLATLVIAADKVWERDGESHTRITEAENCLRLAETLPSALDWLPTAQLRLNRLWATAESSKKVDIDDSAWCTFARFKLLELEARQKDFTGNLRRRLTFLHARILQQTGRLLDNCIYDLQTEVMKNAMSPGGATVDNSQGDAIAVTDFLSSLKSANNVELPELYFSNARSLLRTAKDTSDPEWLVFDAELQRNLGFRSRKTGEYNKSAELLYESIKQACDAESLVAEDATSFDGAAGGAEMKGRGAHQIGELLTTIYDDPNASLSEQSTHHLQLSVRLLGLGRVEDDFEGRELDYGIKFLASGLESATETKDLRAQGKSHLRIGQAYVRLFAREHERTAYDPAKHHFNCALDRAERIPDPKLFDDARKALRALKKSLGDAENGIA